MIQSIFVKSTRLPPTQDVAIYDYIFTLFSCGIEYRNYLVLQH